MSIDLAKAKAIFLQAAEQSSGAARQALLEAAGFTVEARPMSEGTPFGNVLFVALRR